MNKYKQWYDTLISTRRVRIIPAEVYSESHHILPRSLGGNNDPTNKIDLLPREHFIAHLLLARIHIGQNGMKMVHALRRMLTGHKDKRYIPNSRIYHIIRTMSMEKCSNINNPMWGRSGDKHPNYGKYDEIWTPELRAKIGATSKGRVWTDEQRAKRKISQTAHWAKPENKLKQSERLTGRKFTEEHKQKIKQSAIGRLHSDETKALISATKKKNNSQKK